MTIEPKEVSEVNSIFGNLSKPEKSLFGDAQIIKPVDEIKDDAEKVL